MAVTRSNDLRRRDAPYRSGRSKTWLKVKNPASLAMLRFDG
jgi:ATP-dependent DNA ligase